jgi:replicative superfamily II helicase
LRSLAHRYFTDLVSKAVATLQEHECCQKVERQGLGGDDNFGIVPTPLGKAASKFYLVHTTPREMRDGLRRLRDDIVDDEEEEENFVVRVLEIISFCSEFDELPVRHNEELLNQELANEITFKLPDAMEFEDPHVKGYLLLQAYIERSKLPISDYITDTKSVVDQVGRLLAALLFIATEGREGLFHGMLDVTAAVITAKQSMTRRAYATAPFLFQMLGGVVDPGSHTSFAKKVRAGDGSSDRERHRARELIEPEAQRESCVERIDPEAQRELCRAH